MNKLNHLFEHNKKWANRIKNEDPQFFSRLSQEQEPNYLWIGCSDSRVPPNQLLDLKPGEVFVHRNIANTVVHTDFNCLSVIQYAVEVLKVDHIIVCGHYGCGGIKAANDEQDHGLIDNWLRHIKDVSRHNKKKIRGLEGEEKLNKLCELNVIEQVRNVGSTPIVQQAWKQGDDLSVHGLIYSLEEGRLKDMDTCISSPEELDEL